MKRAVVYYSLSGNTKKVAEKIAKELSCDLIEIETLKPMPKVYAAQIMYGGMQASFSLKPRIKPIPAPILSYDELIIGCPIWAGKHAPAINTFIHLPGMARKIIAVFTLNGGGKNEKCQPGLRAILPSLKAYVDLYDKKLDKEKENEELLSDFLERIYMA